MVLSKSERDLYTQAAALDVRYDGRRRLEARFFDVQSGQHTAVPGAFGAARVSVNDGETEVVVGIKAQVISAQEMQTYDQGTIQCEVQRQLLQDDNQSLQMTNIWTTALTELYQNGGSFLDLRDLCIIPHRYAWKLCIDAVVLSCGGNVLDTLCWAVFAAFVDIKLPLLKIIGAEDEEIHRDPNTGYIVSLSEPLRWIDLDFEIADRYVFEPLRLDYNHLPIYVSFYKLGSKFVLDPCSEEEACSQVHFCVGVNAAGAICGVKKWLKGGIAASVLLSSINDARRVGMTQIKKLIEMT